VALTALLLIRDGPRLRRAAVALGAAAAVATAGTAAAFSLAGSASAGARLEGADELAFALLGLAVIAWGSTGVQCYAAGALGCLAVFVGLTKLPVFEHGVVLSEFPAALTRAALGSAIWVGAAAALVGLAVVIAQR
jgi:hypothetical protein